MIAPLLGVGEDLEEQSHRILVVDDEPDIVEFVDLALGDDPNIQVDATCDGGEAIRRIEERRYAVVLTDLKMPEPDGHEVLRAVRTLQPQASVVVLTGHGTIEETVALMREGAYSVLTKPCTVNEVRMITDKAVRHHELCQANEDLKVRLDRASRLAMIGKLAAGVAHELNSPIDGVLRFVNLSLTKLETDPPAVRTYLEEARRGLDRMTSIVRSLLTFSRNVVLEQEEENLRALLDECVRSMRATQDREIEIAVREVPGDAAVPKGLSQVFTNLLKNACDATPDGGHILAEAANEGGELVIRICDDGSGIDPAVRERIFEPFFTTKEVGKGTGLGLPICARIMERFNGSITVESAPDGGGTTVTLRLPLARNARRAPVPRDESR